MNKITNKIAHKLVDLPATKRTKDRMFKTKSHLVTVIDYDPYIGLIFDRTCFYPGGGGQVCDKGTIDFTGIKKIVIDVTQTPHGVIIHWVKRGSNEMSLLRSGSKGNKTRH